ncbi:SDR family NAD(P)-dependent oxidoreductase [Streptomyces sp. NPDC093591]|uniref:SDR family NAD(P)-dependent oxidoreductase n=1 Tax=Streptomyces sp. NPDC093591 TaxID=3366044 RepID=UPI003809A3C0
MGRLDGKIAFISGTGTGIGRAAARIFAAEGALVFGCDIDEDRAAETVELVEKTGGTARSGTSSTSRTSVRARPGPT